jgi:hypothetical protein
MVLLMENLIQQLKEAMEKESKDLKDFRLLEDLANTIFCYLEEIGLKATASDDYGMAANVAEILAEVTKNARSSNFTVRTNLAKRLPEKSIQVGGWEIESQWSKKRSKWENERLVQMVVASEIGSDNLGVSDARLLTKDGEIVALGLEEITEMVTSAVMKSVRVDYWKVKPLQARFGQTFDVDRFCESEWGEPTVKIKPITE